MAYQYETLSALNFGELCEALLAQEHPGARFVTVGDQVGVREALRFGSKLVGGFRVVHTAFISAAHEGDPLNTIVAGARAQTAKAVRLRARGATTFTLITNATRALTDPQWVAQFDAELTESMGMPAQSWWREDLDSRLDASWGLRLLFPSLLPGDDLLAGVLLQQGNDSAINDIHRRFGAIRTFLTEQYAEDENVKFKQVELENKLLELFIDLPFRLTLARSQAKIFAGTQNVLGIRAYEESQGVLRLQAGFSDDDELGTATLLLSRHGELFLRQAVMEGAPGQGKSTLAQYTCQVHRIRWLQRRQELSRIPVEHRTSPLRLPFRVDLRDLGAWLSGTDPFDLGNPAHGEERTLESFLARLVRLHADGVAFDTADLCAVSRLVPLFIVLDGLDEVADRKRRLDVINAVTHALSQMRLHCRELRMIVTTRPAAFANSTGFDSDEFGRLELGSVTRGQIDAYAKRWMDARGLLRRERADFERILRDKMDQPHLRDLSRNPMQLAILLSLIRIRGAALPDRRTNLYDSYVDVFFSREADKSSAVGAHLELLKDIHRFLAWNLHTAAEIGKTEGRIATADLLTLLRQYLEGEAHDPDIVDEVFTATVDRVVMLVSRVEDTYEFEVQPLREYFAARYLYDTASYSPAGGERAGTKPDRFDAVSRNFYWLNVTRFFAGCFSKGELLDLVDRVRNLIADSTFGWTAHPVTLATMLLGDWVFSQSPRAVSEMIEAVCTHDGLKRMAVRMDYHPRISQLPAKSGGDVLVERVRTEIAYSSTAPDWKSRFCQILDVNATLDDNKEWWLGQLRDGTSSQADWFRVAVMLPRVLSTVRAEEIRSALGGATVDFTSAAQLYSAGRLDVLAGSASSNDIFEIMKTRPVSTRSAISEPLFLVPSFLGAWNTPYIIRYNDMSLMTAIRRFRERSSEELLVPHPDVDTHHAWLFSREFEAVISDDVAHLGLIPDRTWEELLESLRAKWGAGPSIVNAAFNIAEAARRRSSSRTAPLVPLFDGERSLVGRLASLRSHAKSIEAWRTSICEIANEDDALMLLLGFWRWAPLNVVRSVLRDISAIVERLSPSSWTRLIASVHSLASRVASNRDALDESILHSCDSLKVKLLLAHYAYAGLAGPVFLAHFREGACGFENDVTVQEFRQAQAIEAALSRVVSWSEALQIIAETYSAGAVYGNHRLRRYAVRPPISVAQEILGNADRYPAYMFDYSDDVMTSRARRRVRLVGNVARRDRWLT